MRCSRSTVASCLEHERLAFELLKVRTRGQYLTRLRPLTSREWDGWDRRERAARLVDHELEHAAVEALGGGIGRYEMVICHH